MIMEFAGRARVNILCHYGFTSRYEKLKDNGPICISRRKWCPAAWTLNAWHNLRVHGDVCRLPRPTNLTAPTHPPRQRPRTPSTPFQVKLTGITNHHLSNVEIRLLPPNKRRWPVSTVKSWTVEPCFWTLTFRLKKNVDMTTWIIGFRIGFD